MDNSVADPFMVAYPTCKSVAAAKVMPSFCLLTAVCGGEDVDGLIVVPQQSSPPRPVCAQCKGAHFIQLDATSEQDAFAGRNIELRGPACSCRGALELDDPRSSRQGRCTPNFGGTIASPKTNSVWRSKLCDMCNCLLFISCWFDVLRCYHGTFCVATVCYTSTQ